jgi:signal recognition particle subunit SRP54
MTKKERANPSILSSSPSRKKRIAQGSGKDTQSVNKLLKQFEAMKKMMKQVKGMQKGFGKNMTKGMFGKMPF